jgi:hypothetical protein
VFDFFSIINEYEYLLLGVTLRATDINNPDRDLLLIGLKERPGDLGGLQLPWKVA